MINCYMGSTQLLSPYQTLMGEEQKAAVCGFGELTQPVWLHSPSVYRSPEALVNVQVTRVKALLFVC